MYIRLNRCVFTHAYIYTYTYMYDRLFDAVIFQKEGQGDGTISLSEYLYISIYNI
jgi:hypothetical protein